MAESRSAGTRLSHERTGALARMIFNYRLLALTVAVLWLPVRSADFWLLLGCLIVAAASSFLPIKLWSGFGPVLLRHPAYLAADLLLGMSILTAMGPDSPFLYFTLGTSLLSGVLYGWRGALFFGGLQTAVYWASLVVRAEVADVDTFQLLVNIPALYPLTAIAGAAVRGLLDKQAATEANLVEAERDAAVEHERARIAREMHDSLAKTIQGVALSASALVGWTQKDPDRARVEAARVADAARAASGEARELLTGMRADMLDKPLGESVADYVTRWSSSTGVTAHCRAEGVPETEPEVRWELFCIVREALRNIERHARAREVIVRFEQNGDGVVAEVTDDGVGFDVPADLNDLRGNGHFGMLGMSERAARVGGRIEVDSVAGGGTTVRALVPQAGSVSQGALR